MMKITLQIKITLLFISILLISLSGIYLIFMPQVEENIQDQAKDNLENIAINTAGYLEHLIEDELNKITVLSKNPVLKSTGSSTSEKIDELTLYRMQYRTFDEITLLDTNGTVVGSTDYNYRGEWKTKSWYQEALQGNIVVTDAHVILDPWKLVVLVLSPIKNNNGSIIGVVSGQIDLESYWQFLDEIEVGKTSQIKIINNNGKILYHANRSKIFSKISESNPLYSLDFSDSGSSEYMGACNVTFICGYTPFLEHTIYNNTGSWHMMVSQQESEILLGLSDFKQNIFYGSMVFCIFLFIIGFLVSHNIVKPVIKLNKGMTELSNGNFDYTVPVKGNDELTMLLKSFNSMGEKLKQLTTKIEERNKLVETLLRQKDEFINQLGHDLKNPLGPLVNLLPILEKKAVDEKDKDIITVLNRNVRYMKNLITNTLELARLNSPNTKFNMEELSLKEQLDQILGVNKLLFEKKQMTVVNNLSDTLIIHADKLRIEELFTNLLNNAVKYSNENGTITINAEQKDQEIQLSIQDTGIGMTEEQLNKLFTEFYKADPSRHDFDSSGLGLTIAKRIVEKHGGRIWAESEGLGKGSTFYFTLPSNHTIFQGSDIQEIDTPRRINENHDIHSSIDMLFK